MVKDFYIPVENKVSEFKHHLDCHPRTILSAKFGDGKSYFLKKFCEDDRVLQEYEFITIYPVNYQVLDNDDVFDILKRDIILQMGAKGMISESESFVSEEMALLYCIKNKGVTLFEALLDVAANSLTSNISILGKFCKSAVKLLKTFSDAKKEYDKVKTTDIDKLIEQVSKITVDEEDLYSRIIKRNLDEWRSVNGKKIALIIEDMDRLDPAHIFRILNVLSAQLDSCYYGGIESDIYSKNKMGLDNVVLVMHYDNLLNIYKHIYSDNADFEGYISKFVTGRVFIYSLEHERINHFYEVLVNGIGIPKELVKKLIPDTDIKGLSLRKISKALVSPELQFDESIRKSRMMRMFVVMYRLLESSTSVVNNIVNTFGADYSSVVYDLTSAFIKSGMVCDDMMIISKGNASYVYKFNDGRFLHYFVQNSSNVQGMLTPIVVASKLVGLIYK